jgi:hypothetical protein
MAQGKVIGGQHVDATISINFKRELALSGGGFKRTPNLTAANVASWEEVPVEQRGSKMDAIGKVGQAVARAGLPGSIGKAAAAAVGSTVDSLMNSTRHVRVEWADGGQSLVSLPQDLFQHLAMLLGDRRIGGDVVAPQPTAPVMPEPSGIVGQIAKFAAPVLGGQQQAQPQVDVMDQLAKLGQLRDAGVLTAEEFAAKKADLLGRL